MFRSRYVAVPRIEIPFLSFFALLNNEDVHRVALGVVLATILVAISTTTQAFAMAPSQAAQTTIQSETTLGASLPGVMLTVDGNRYATPFSLTLQGSHTLAARTIPRSNGVFYRFVRWEDETGATISNRISFTYDFQKAKVMSAVYASPPPSGKPIWSTWYESGDHRDFSVGNDQPLICAGNNPGQVVSTRAHSGTYSGYYYIDDPRAGDGCRAYYDLDFYGDNHVPYYPNLRDIYTEVWVYVPSVTLTGWVTFVNIKFKDWLGVTIDSGPDRKLYIWNEDLFTENRAYQSGNGVQWPFDKWFKIGVEIHYRPASEVSTLILYQDDIAIVTQRTHATNAQPLPLWNFHWGLYTGGQTKFAVYNDDIAVYDLTNIIGTG